MSLDTTQLLQLVYWLIEKLGLLPYIIGAYVLFVVTWVFYIAAMRLIPLVREKKIPTWVLPMAYTAIAMGLVLDACANLAMSFFLLDFPRDLLLTAKLKRLKQKGGWRAKAADRICTDCLDAFDPRGDHC